MKEVYNYVILNYYGIFKLDVSYSDTTCIANMALKQCRALGTRGVSRIRRIVGKTDVSPTTQHG